MPANPRRHGRYASLWKEVQATARETVRALYTNARREAAAAWVWDGFGPPEDIMVTMDDGRVVESRCSRPREWTDADQEALEAWLRSRFAAKPVPPVTHATRLASQLLEAAEAAAKYIRPIVEAQERAGRSGAPLPPLAPADAALLHWWRSAAQPTIDGLQRIARPHAFTVAELIACELHGEKLGFDRPFTRRELACFAVLAGYEKKKTQRADLEKLSVNTELRAVEIALDDQWRRKAKAPSVPEMVRAFMEPRGDSVGGFHPSGVTEVEALRRAQAVKNKDRIG